MCKTGIILCEDKHAFISSKSQLYCTIFGFHNAALMSSRKYTLNVTPMNPLSKIIPQRVTLPSIPGLLTSLCAFQVQLQVQQVTS